MKRKSLFLFLTHRWKLPRTLKSVYAEFQWKCETWKSNFLKNFNYFYKKKFCNSHNSRARLKGFEKFLDELLSSSPEQPENLRVGVDSNWFSAHSRARKSWRQWRTEFIVRSPRSRAADLRLIKSSRIWAKFDDFLWQCESFSYTVRLRKNGKAGFNGTSLTCETRWELGNRSHVMFSGSNAIIWCERRQSCAVCYITMIMTLS